MIDALSVRVHSSAQFTKEFSPLYQEAQRRGILVPAPHYAAAGDFRPMGLPIRLSMYSHPGVKIEERRQSTHKVEIYDTAEKSELEMRDLLKTVFDIPTDEMEITRLDLCTDTVGTSVPWFVRHTQVACKRLRREIGSVQLQGERYMRVAMRTAETWYAGKKPNQIRIYDKTAERHYQLNYENRKRAAAGEKILEFPERWGYDGSTVVTRVERQYGGGRITTFPALKHLAQVNPWDKMHITPNGRKEGPDLALWGGDVTSRLAGMMLARMVEDEGLQGTLAWIRDNCGSNTNRFIDRYKPWLELSDDERPVTVEMLRKNFQKSVSAQLGIEYSAA